MLSPMTSGSTRLTVRRRSSRRSCTNHNRWSCGRDRERAGALPRSSLHLGPVSSVLQHLAQLVVNGIITGTIPAVAYFLARTTIGKAMRAVADNRDLAAVSGVNVERIGTYVWLLAGGLAGIGGVMFAVVQGTVDPNIGAQVLFLIFTTAVLGGIGSAYGALVGGFVLGLVMELSTWEGLFGGLEARFKPVLAFAALIVLLLYRPQGLLGTARVL